MSTVDLAQVLGRLARDGRALDQVLERLDQMGILWIDFDRGLAIGAAALLPPTAPWGLSLGDRAGLAPARTRDHPAITADRAWAMLDLGIRVEVVRLRLTRRAACEPAADQMPAPSSS